MSLGRGLRVAIVCPYTLSAPGGVQGQATGLASWLRRVGAEATVFAPADGPVAVPGLVSLGPSTTFRDNGATTCVALSPRGLARVAAAVRSGFDVVHLQEPMHPACLAALTAASVPTVGTFHMAAERQLWYRIFAPVVRTAVRRLDRRIAVSRSAAEFASEALPGRYEVIPNAIDAAAFAVARGKTGTGRRILFIGRADPRKGLPVLLHAVGRLRPPVELHLAGVEGDEVGALPCGGRGRVHAHGRVSHEALRELLASSDVLVTPSTTAESFGLTVLEGMAAGLPVVASAIPAHRDLLPESCGRLVPPGRPQALAAAIEDVLSSPDARAAMGHAGRRAAAAYDWAAVGPRIIEVYRQELATCVAA